MDVSFHTHYNDTVQSRTSILFHILILLRIFIEPLRDLVLHFSSIFAFADCDLFVTLLPLDDPYVANVDRHTIACNL